MDTKLHCKPISLSQLPFAFVQMEVKTSQNNCNNLWQTYLFDNIIELLTSREGNDKQF